MRQSVNNLAKTTHTVELSKNRGEEPAGWAPVGGEVEGDDLLPFESRVRCHHALVPPQNLLTPKTVHLCKTNQTPNSFTSRSFKELQGVGEWLILGEIWIS